jgi:hypothetical protein
MIKINNLCVAIIIQLPSYVLQAPGNFLGRYWRVFNEKDQQRMPMDATFYSSVSALNSRAGAAPIFQRGSKWVEPLAKMRMWQEAYGVVAMAMENRRRAVTRWQGGIYSPKNSTQDCRAPENYDKLSATKSSSLSFDQRQTPLGWTFMSQLLILFAVGIGISILAFLLELAYFMTKTSSKH